MRFWRVIFPCCVFLVQLLFHHPCWAQELKVKNVRFEEQGDKVSITYDLDGDASKRYLISIALSFDRGKTFPLTLEHLSGDVGKGIRPGSPKAIVWNLGEQFPFGLKGGDFVFSVTAHLQKGWLHKVPYYVIGTGIAGGVVYWATRKAKARETGITITIPAEY